MLFSCCSWRAKCAVCPPFPPPPLTVANASLRENSLTRAHWHPPPPTPRQGVYVIYLYIFVVTLKGARGRLRGWGVGEVFYSFSVRINIYIYINIRKKKKGSRAVRWGSPIARRWGDTHARTHAVARALSRLGLSAATRVSTRERSNTPSARRSVWGGNQKKAARKKMKRKSIFGLFGFFTMSGVHLVLLRSSLCVVSKPCSREVLEVRGK